MEKFLQCQSCGMTFDEQHKKFIAKEKDGSDSIFCTYCYKDGEFIDPNATMEDMIEIAVPHFARKTGNEETARKYMTEVVSCLSRWKINEKIYEYDAVIQSSEIGKGGAYVPFPYDLRAEFGKGRVKVHATFDGEPYDGSIVNMGVKNTDGSVCYIIGILKDIRAKIGKQPGDTVRVTIKERM